MSKLSKKEARIRRHRRLRRKVHGTAARPRMSVCRTANHLYVQFIDDDAMKTLVAASTVEKTCAESGAKCSTAGAAVLGRMAAERALAAEIKKVVFDRGGFQFHGRIRALAEAAREAGLEF